jgi:addiction module HigA family antidote
MINIPTNRRPTSPGEILFHEFLDPLGITQAAFAKHVGITSARLSEIIHGKRAVTMDTALRFERALGFSAEAWMRMQLAVDMYDATHGPIAKAVSRIKLIRPNDASRDRRRRPRAA